MQASIELTNRCNERCTHCYIPDYKDDPLRLLDLEQWKDILKQLKAAGTLYLILMGGEAMLSPHFWPIAETAKKMGFSLSMITNGLLINEVSAQRLSEIGFADITFSLYSINPEIHDKMTKVYGSCEKTKKALELCIKYKIPAHVNCLLTSANIEAYFETADWCIERNIPIRFDPLITPKFDGNNAPTKLRATREQLVSFYQKHSTIWPNSTPTPSREAATDYLCNAAKGKCAITAYGDLLTCIEIREPLGNLRNQSFAEIWQSQAAQKWRHFKFQDLKENDKTLVSFCDHCPGMAIHEKLDPLTPIPYAKMVAEIKREIYKTYGGKSEKTKNASL